ncbi:hypothetical protein Halha_1265 [Halobacteroides halobius DSM 5150]|uniref:Uncharacterized protein n=1 Tax=Halobacteroides halobius (strain ATCC 35273 / DSM 5150 / MD-1) TaxID=748449 RepID=L0K862_HALHC|nr:hypothetical protein [Halobacteroides halobius]AGB41211.1 hypothetical protein Halha_1265 [Halobacteroides halobius DSM 5150]
MKLSDFLTKSTNQHLNQLAQQHHICYEDDFSKLWVRNKLQRKLLNKKYLYKIIQQLEPAAQETLKQLTTTEFINKETTNPKTCYQLKKVGLIYEKNNFYYLPQDIKKILSNKWQDKKRESIPKLKPLSIKSKAKTTSKINVKQPVELSFYHYLLLILSQIKKNKDQKELLSYLEEINFTSFSNKKLLQYLIRYSKYNNLVTADLTLQPKFKTWLQTDYSKKILQGIEAFFPYSKNTLRQITAVLSHKSTASKLNLEFIEDNIELNHNSKNLLELLDIFHFTKDSLSLTSKANKAFAPENDLEFTAPQISKEKIIIDSTISLSALWKICQSSQLIAINNQLIFTSNSEIKKFR